MRRPRPLFLAGVLLALLLSALALVSCGGSKSYRAQSFDVEMTVQGNGAAVVTETVTFSFQNGPFTYAFREIPLDKTSGIDSVQVSEDGERYTVGSGANQYETKMDSNNLRVTWHFAATENRRRTFVLSYRVNGLVRQDGAQDALLWGLVPPKHDYGITRVEAFVHLPGNVGPVSGVRVLAGAAEIDRYGSTLRFVASDVEEDHELTFGVWFPHGQLSGVPPAWQARQTAQNKYAPLWWAVAAVVLLGGLAGVVWAARKWGRERFNTPLSPLQAPPSDLAPGLAGTLVANGSTAGDLLATVFDLSRRGVLAIDEVQTTGGKRPKREFAVVRVGQAAGLQPWEQAVLDAAFKKARGADGRVSLPDMAAGLVGDSGTIGRQMADALREQGFFGPVRDRIRRFMLYAAGGLFLLALLTIVLVVLWYGSFGAWPALVTAALFVLSFAVLILALGTARRTQAGEQAAANWRSFRDYLRQLSRGKARADLAQQYTDYLAYAVAFGYGDRWSKQMAAAGSPLPSWFHVLSEEAAAEGVPTAVFVAMIVAATTHAGAAGVAAAGGAAGGGASGAG